MRKNVKYNTETVYSVARRGTFFDSASVTIRDEGNGDIGVSAHANLRQPAEELYVSLYLDRYDEKKVNGIRLIMLTLNIQ